ncbi:MAG: hypothetical protein IPN08_14005 [Bacteroidales bacterium]|nr:hypothetical protein [Bacteroidales bacterium]
MRRIYRPINVDQEWPFSPLAKSAIRYCPVTVMGGAKENWIGHKIMVPFKFEGKYTVKSVKAEGGRKHLDTIQQS